MSGPRRYPRRGGDEPVKAASWSTVRDVEMVDYVR